MKWTEKSSKFGFYTRGQSKSDITLKVTTNTCDKQPKVVALYLQSHINYNWWVEEMIYNPNRKDIWA